MRNISMITIYYKITLINDEIYEKRDSIYVSNSFLIYFVRFFFYNFILILFILKLVIH